MPFRRWSSSGIMIFMAGDPLNIIILDDDKFLLDMYAMKLTQAGHKVNPCFSVDEALQALRSGFVPDAIVFDLVMPGRDGFDFLRAMADEKLAPKACRIALTNQGGEEERKKCFELGADEYVVKATTIPSEVVGLVTTAVGKYHSQ